MINSLKQFLNLQIVVITFSVFNSCNALAKKELKPCPTMPNCVSSFSSDSTHFIAPFKIIVSVDQAKIAIKNALLHQERTVITEETSNTFHAEATSFVFRFVDDIDIMLDIQAKIFHIRSASRVGYSDFGVNRRRLEQLRFFLQQEKIIE